VTGLRRAPTVAATMALGAIALGLSPVLATGLTAVAAAGARAASAVVPREPASIAVAPHGGLYIADPAPDQILERSASGSYSVIAGTGPPGLTGDGGPATRGELNGPGSLLPTSSGALYFVQTGTEKAGPGGVANTVIREITPTGVLRTVAGLHPSCPRDHAATSVAAESAWMYGAGLSFGPGGVLEVTANPCPNVSKLGPFLELTVSGELRDNSPDRIGAASISCGGIVEGQGFATFVCDSGGGATAFGHPKELLVVRANGSTAAYPAYEDGPLAAGDGEVVAGYNYAVVRVTSHGISVLVSYRQLVGLVSDSDGVAGIIGLAVDQHGDVFVVASLYHHKDGCATTIAERAASGALERFWSATGQICG
jgi:hypothetical protein